jgi:uncharacterized protein YdhG (YjbR/CyaY superfamily)
MQRCCNASYKVYAHICCNNEPLIIRELNTHKQSKGTVQFPLDKPIPFDLVTKIVEFRVKENEAKKK